MEQAILDPTALDRLLELIGGAREDLDELLEDYHEAAPELAQRISAAAAAGDREAMRVAAHTLKSNARDFGALRLSSLCATLEQDCRTGEIANAEDAAAAIVAEEEIARKALSSLARENL